MIKTLCYFLMISLLLISVAAFSQDGANQEHQFIGTSKCKKCHLKRFKSWKETQIANVFDLLKPGDRAEVAKVVADQSPSTATCTSRCYNDKARFFKPFNFDERKDQGTHQHFPLRYEQE